MQGAETKGVSAIAEKGRKKLEKEGVQSNSSLLNAIVNLWRASTKRSYSISTPQKEEIDASLMVVTQEGNQVLTFGGKKLFEVDKEVAVDANAATGEPRKGAMWQ